MILEANYTLDIASLLIGFVVGGVLAVCLTVERVGVAMTRCLSALSIAAGTGLLAWGAALSMSTSPAEAMQLGPIVLTCAGQTFGWATVCLVAGTAGLALSSAWTPRPWIPPSWGRRRSAYRH